MKYHKQSGYLLGLLTVLIMGVNSANAYTSTIQYACYTNSDDRSGPPFVKWRTTYTLKATLHYVIMLDEEERLKQQINQALSVNDQTVQDLRTKLRNLEDLYRYLDLTYDSRYADKPLPIGHFGYNPSPEQLKRYQEYTDLLKLNKPPIDRLDVLKAALKDDDKQYLRATFQNIREVRSQLDDAALDTAKMDKNSLTDLRNRLAGLQAQLNDNHTKSAITQKFWRAYNETLWNFLEDARVSAIVIPKLNNISNLLHQQTQRANKALELNMFLTDGKERVKVDIPANVSGTRFETIVKDMGKNNVFQFQGVRFSITQGDKSGNPITKKWVVIYNPNDHQAQLDITTPPTGISKKPVVNVNTSKLYCEAEDFIGNKNAVPIEDDEKKSPSAAPGEEGVELQPAKGT